MHAYVINLARSAHRRAHIIEELRRTGMDYEIVTAVDGRELDLGDRSVVDADLATHMGLPDDPGNSIYAGSVGCALSHLEVYRTLIAQDRERALVLEDDVLLPDDLDALAEEVAAQLSGAEIAMLSYDSPEPCRMAVEDSVRLPSGRVLALPVDVRQPRSGAAYIITRDACERMVKSALPVRVLADDWWYYYREGVLDRVRCVVPLPVVKSADHSSTIGSYSQPTGLRARLAGLLLKRRIPGVHQALAWRRRGIYRRWGQSELVDVPFVEKASRLA